MRTGWLAIPRVLFSRHLSTETYGAVKTSIFIRHIDGGSSNVFESELAALTNPIYDLAQYGIHFVASPSHADVLLLTGPLTRNMLDPAREAFAVMPEPKSIVTIGDYADVDRRHEHTDRIVGELAYLFSCSYATTDLPEDMRRAVVAHVPGDPPEPKEIIQALLAVAAGPWPRRRNHRRPAR